MNTWVQQLMQNAAVQKVRRFFPAASFLGGFLWDSLTLGKMVQSSDLAVLLVYYLASFLFLLLLAAKEGVWKWKPFSEKWKERFACGVQFCFGSLFSALVICYFKSSSSLSAFVLVAVLCAFLVANEFLQKRYLMFAFTLALFSLLGTMYLNFLIPHLVNGMGFLWFLLSVVISFGCCLIAYKVSHRSKKTLVAPVGISLVLIHAYLLNWIPPVPLVLKDQNACVGFSKDYSCYVDKPGFLERMGIFSPTVTLSNEAPGVAFVSSVFAPSKVEAQLEHRWYRKNEKTGKFELMNRISSARMRTHGSREEGFRIYTVKKNIPEGKWKVETAVKGGSVIGAKSFYVRAPGEAPPERTIWKIR